MASAQGKSASTFSPMAERPFEWRQRISTAEGLVEGVARCEVRITDLYCPRDSTCKASSLTLRARNTVQPTLHIISAKRNGSSSVLCPFVQVRGGHNVSSCDTSGVGGQRMGSPASPSHKPSPSGGRSSWRSGGRRVRYVEKCHREAADGRVREPGKAEIVHDEVVGQF